MFIEFCETLFNVNIIASFSRSFVAPNTWLINAHITNHVEVYFEEFQTEEEREDRWIYLKGLLEAK